MASVMALRQARISIVRLHLAALILIAAGIVWPAAAAAQQRASQRSPLEMMTARSIGMAFSGNWSELRSMYDEMVMLENAESIFPSRALRERNFLQDNLFDLYTATVSPNREEMLEALEFIKGFPYRDTNSRFFLAMARDKTHKFSLNRLERRIFYSRFASVFNRLGSGLSQLMSGQTIVLLQLPVDAVYSIWRLRVANPLERKLLWMKTSYLQQRHYVENEMKMSKDIQTLQAKVQTAYFLQDLERGKMALRQGDLMIADFYFSKAASRNPKSTRTAERRDDVRRQMRDDIRRQQDANAIMRTADPIGGDGDAREEITQLLAAGQFEESSDVAQRWASDDPSRAQMDDIELVDAVVAYALGYRQRARVYFMWIAGRYSRESSGQYAKAILKSPWHFPRLTIDDARAQYRADTRRFIFLGHQPDDYAYVTATQAARLQPAWVRDVAFLFVVDSLVRGIYATVNNPISRDGLLDAARMAHLRLGRDEDPGPILNTLRKNYEESGRYDQAVLYATLQNLPDSKIQKLKDKEVKSLYRSILQVRDVELRLHLFKRLQADYPGSMYEKKIDDAISDLTDKTAVFGTMDKKTFARYIYQFNQSVMYLDPAYVDGKRGNGELSKKGVTLRKDKTLNYREEYLKQDRMIPLADEEYKRAVEFFAMHNRLVQVEKARGSHEMAEKAYLEIRGGIGTSGADLYPGIAPAAAGDETRALFD